MLNKKKYIKIICEKCGNKPKFKVSRDTVEQRILTCDCKGKYIEDKKNG